MKREMGIALTLRLLSRYSNYPCEASSSILSQLRPLPSMLVPAIIAPGQAETL